VYARQCEPLGALAALPPVAEIHKQLILLAIGVVQFSEGWLLAKAPKRGAAYIVLLKIALATLNAGYVRQGRINREGVVTDQDPITGTPFSYPKGFFLVDDGPRRTNAARRPSSRRSSRFSRATGRYSRARLSVRPSTGTS